MKRKLAIICSKNIAHDKLRMGKKKTYIKIVKVSGRRWTVIFQKKSFCVAKIGLLELKIIFIHFLNNFMLIPTWFLPIKIDNYSHQKNMKFLFMCPKNNTTQLKCKFASYLKSPVSIILRETMSRPKYWEKKKCF